MLVVYTDQESGDIIVVEESKEEDIATTFDENQFHTRKIYDGAILIRSRTEVKEA